MIEIKNLTKYYGRLVALSDLSLSIAPGTIFGFIGPNGAGKTTTMRILATLLGPTPGGRTSTTWTWCATARKSAAWSATCRTSSACTTT